MPIGTTAALIGSVAAPLIGSAIGSASASGDEDAAREAQLRALQAIQNLQTPELKDLQVQLAKYKSAGQLTPQMEAAILQQASGLKDIKKDPRMKDAQLAALAQMQDVSKGGLRMEDKAAINQIFRKGAQAAKGQREAILQRNQAQGMGGSGNELAAQLMASQGAMEEANQQGFDVGALASKRALEAMMASGDMAGNISARDFDEQSQVASAQDAINQFNTQNRQRVAGSNVDRSNRGQEMNLANQQDIMNRNTGTQHDQAKFNANAVQQDFNNRFSKASGVSRGEGDMANAYQNSANNTRNQWSQIGQGVGSGLSAAAGYAVQREQNQSPVTRLNNGNANAGRYVRAPGMAHGGQVPGEASYEGDHPDNDTVPAVLSPGEIVIPRSHSQSPKDAKKYIDKLALDKWNKNNG